MPFALSVALLFCVAAVGLAHLAVRHSAAEHRVASAIVLAVAVPFLLVSLAASALLLVAGAGTRLLRVPPARVPDRVPDQWGQA